MVQRDAAGVVPTATEALDCLGYRVATAVIDLTDLGVPQRRRRHLLLASRDRRVDPKAILKTEHCMPVPLPAHRGVGDP